MKRCLASRKELFHGIRQAMHMDRGLVYWGGTSWERHWHLLGLNALQNLLSLEKPTAKFEAATIGTGEPAAAIEPSHMMCRIYEKGYVQASETCYYRK